MVDPLNFTIGWKGLPKEDTIKIQCKKATDLAYLNKKCEPYRQLTKLLADNAFQKKVSYNWLWDYCKFIDPAITIFKQTTPQESEPDPKGIHITITHFLEEGLGGFKVVDIKHQKLMKDTYVKEELRKQKANYSTEENISIYIMTYNAGGKKPKMDEESMLTLFCGISANNQNSLENSLVLPDLYIFCFQEVCPLNPKTLIAKTDHAQVWEDHLIKSLNNFSVKKTKGAVEYSVVHLSFV